MVGLKTRMITAFSSLAAWARAFAVHDARSTAAAFRARRCALGARIDRRRLIYAFGLGGRFRSLTR
jgi:hypothetical protein